MRVLMTIVGAACALSLPTWAQPQAAVPAPAARPAPSPEHLQALRQTLLARIAQYDAVEKSYRAPTDAERAGLAAPTAAAAPRIVTLANGATAVKGDAGEVSLLVVELQPDGKPAIGHAPSARDRAAARAAKEVRHAP